MNNISNKFISLGLCLVLAVSIIYIPPTVSAAAEVTDRKTLGFESGETFAEYNNSGYEITADPAGRSDGQNINKVFKNTSIESCIGGVIKNTIPWHGYIRTEFFIDADSEGNLSGGGNVRIAFKNGNSNDYRDLFNINASQKVFCDGNGAWIYNSIKGDIWYEVTVFIDTANNTLVLNLIEKESGKVLVKNHSWTIDGLNTRTGMEGHFRSTGEYLYIDNIDIGLIPTFENYVLEATSPAELQSRAEEYEGLGAFIMPSYYKDLSADYKLKLMTAMYNNINSYTTKALFKTAIDSLETKPVAFSASISGTPHAGETLTADFEYFQAKDTQKGTTIYTWQSAPTSDGTYTDVSGATSDAYPLTSSDERKCIRIKITPVTSGNVQGDSVYSDYVLIKAAPVAKDIEVVGNPIEGGYLCASYTYEHPIAESGSLRRWISINPDTGVELEELGTGLLYQVKNSDIGQTIVFEVTPRTTEAPDTGESIRSTPMLVLANSSGSSAPIADGLDISFSDSENKFTAEYTADLDKSNDVITWYISDSQNGTYTPSGDVGYEVSFSDTYKNKWVKFSVIPVNSDGLYGSEAGGNPQRIYELPTASDLIIDGEIVNEGTVYALYDFSTDISAYNQSKITWLLEGSPVSNSAEYQIPSDATGKTLQFKVESKSSVFPKIGTPVLSATQIVAQNSFVAPFEGDGVTKSTIYPGANPGDRFDIVTKDGTEVLATKSNITDPYLSLTTGSGIIALDMRFLADGMGADGNSGTSTIRIQQAQGNTKQWVSLMDITHSGSVSNTAETLQNGRWYNMRAVINTETQKIKLYLGSDINHMKLIREWEESTLYDTDSTLSTFQVLNNTTTKLQYYISNIDVSSVDIFPEAFAGANSVEELRAVTDFYDKLDVLKYPSDFSTADDEELILNTLLNEKSTLTTSVLFKSRIDTLSSKHQNGAKYTSLKLVDNNSKEYAKDEKITGITSLQTIARINNVTSSDADWDYITAIYEKSANGNKTLVSYNKKDVHIAAGTTADISSDIISSLDDKKEYSVRVFLWDSIDAPGLSLAEKAFNDFDKSINSDASSAPGADVVINTPDVDTPKGLIDITGNSTEGDGTYINLIVKNPSGDVIYLDQIYNIGDRAYYGTDFTLLSPAESGIYTAYVYENKTSESANRSFSVDTDTARPTAAKPFIEGDNFYGTTVKAAYIYYQVGGVPKDTASYVWYISDTLNGTYQPITGAVSETYYLDKSISGKYIKASVKPVTDTGIQGDIAYTEPVRVLMLPEAQNVSIVGSAYVGYTVSGAYTFIEPLFGYVESGSTHAWYRNGILVGTQQSYTITSADAGQSLVYEVTPKMSQYPMTGAAVRSSAIIPSVYTGGYDGGGGGGGGYSAPPAATPVINTPPTQQTGTASPFKDTEYHWGATRFRTSITL